MTSVIVKGKGIEGFLFHENVVFVKVSEIESKDHWYPCI